MTADLPLMESVLMTLAKSVLLLLDYQQECQQQMQLLKREFMDQELHY